VIGVEAPSQPFVPAEAGTQALRKNWVPASAGTNGDGSVRNLRATYAINHCHRITRRCVVALYSLIQSKQHPRGKTGLEIS